MLVDSLASDWGSRSTETGKTVWFTLAIDPGHGYPCLPRMMTTGHDA